MNVQLSREEQQILVDLLDSRMRELHPTIRRSRVSTVTDELKHDLESVERLLAKIQNARTPETAATTADSSHN